MAPCLAIRGLSECWGASRLSRYGAMLVGTDDDKRNLLIKKHPHLIKQNMSLQLFLAAADTVLVTVQRWCLGATQVQERGPVSLRRLARRPVEQCQHTVSRRREVTCLHFMHVRGTAEALPLSLVLSKHHIFTMRWKCLFARGGSDARLHRETSPSQGAQNWLRVVKRTASIHFRKLCCVITHRRRK